MATNNNAVTSQLEYAKRIANSNLLKFAQNQTIANSSQSTSLIVSGIYNAMHVLLLTMSVYFPDCGWNIQSHARVTLDYVSLLS